MASLNATSIIMLVFAVFATSAPGLADTFAPPRLPSNDSTSGIAPWGGTQPSKRRPEAHLANLMSDALNEAWSQSPAPTDVIVAVPIKMIATDFNQNGDGQLNSAITFGSWKSPENGPQYVAPLVAAFAQGSNKIIFRFSPGAVAPGAGLVIRYTDDSGVAHDAPASLPANSLGLEWPVPQNLHFGAPLGRKGLALSTNGGKSWYPIWFRIPMRPIQDYMTSVTSDFSTYKDAPRHSILDREEVGALFHPGDSKTAIDRLLEKQANHRFTTPFGIHFNKPGLHDKIPVLGSGEELDEDEPEEGPVNPANPKSYTTVGVGQFWNWTPFSDLQHLVQPLSVHYLCLDKRNPKLEDPLLSNVPKDGGVTTGANWHRVHLEFTNDQKIPVPLGGAEIFFNNLETRPVLAGFASANPLFKEIAGSAYAFSKVGQDSKPVPGSGLTDVATFRFLRPGELFLTPNSGSLDNLTDPAHPIDQSTFHTVYSYQSDSPGHPETAACVEVWTPPCTPGDELSFTCGRASVTLRVHSKPQASGTRLFFQGVSKYAINVDGKPLLKGPKLGTADTDGNTLLELSPGPIAGGKQSWSATLQAPWSTLIHYQIFKAPPSGARTTALSGDFPVEVVDKATIDAAGVVQ